MRFESLEGMQEMQDSSWRASDVGEESSEHQGGLKKSGEDKGSCEDATGFLVQVTERERLETREWQVQ